MSLYAHQQQLIDQDPKAHLLAWGTGTGKTLTAIKLSMFNCPLLVICPKSLVENWEREIQRWACLPKENYLVLSKEQFKKWIKDGKQKQFRTVVVDEAHYFYGRTSTMYKSLKWFLEKYPPERKYFLTATPYLSTPWNIYCAADLVGRKLNYKVFEQAFFRKVKMGRQMIPVIRSTAKEDVAKLVKQLGSTKALEECVDVPEQIFMQEYFDPTPSQRKALGALTDPVHIVKWTKAHQILGGTLKGDGYRPDQSYDCEKLSRLKEIVESNTHGVAVVCRYNAEIENLKEELAAYGPVFCITGATKARDAVVQQVNQTERPIVLINAACSEGYGLPNIPLMVFYSYDFSLKNYIQMLGRIQRLNNVKKNIYLSLVIKGTIDEDIFKTVAIDKRDFQLEIYKKV